MKVFCIGEAVYDVTLPVEKFITEGENLITKKKIECGGGTASNVACLLADWQEKVYFFGAIGNDYYGKKIKDSFFLHNVNTRYLTIKESCHTATSNIIVNQSNATSTKITFKDENLTTKVDYFILKKPNVIYFDGNEYQLCLKMTNKYPKATKILSANKYDLGTISLFNLMNYVIITENFIHGYLGKKIKLNTENLKKVIKQLEIEYKTTFIITLGTNGTYLKIGNNYKLIPSIKVKSIDITSCLDIYYATFVYFISHNYSLIDTVTYSNIAYAISTTRFGSRFKIPLIEEVKNYENR